MRILCVVLSACVLASASGCKSGERRAQEHRNRVSAGMTQAQVVDQVGYPDEIRNHETEKGVELWFYEYGPGGAGFWIGVALLAVTVIGIIALGAIGSNAHYFKVEFGADGKVREVGPPRSSRTPAEFPFSSSNP